MFKQTSLSRGAGSAEVTGFYEKDTGSIQYVASDPETGKAAIIDAVLGFHPERSATDASTIEPIVEHVSQKGFEVEWILDTHPHADHLMASAMLKDKLGAPNAIGEKVREIAELWTEYYNLPGVFVPQRDFDRLWEDGDRFSIGNQPVRVMLSAGHTLGSVTYVIGDDAAFVHDTFMQPDAGTSRADFPGGSASTLYETLQEILSLPDDTRLFIGHDYGTDDRDEPAWESTVAEQRRDNIHVGGGVDKDAYVERREDRDATLALPDRMLHVLQMNLRAGRLPETEDDGHSYLKIPLNKF